LTPSPWTAERVDALKKLWADGLSASQVAARLGVTRGSVTGKVNRLGLARDKPAPRTASRARRPKPTPPHPTKQQPQGGFTLQDMGNRDARLGLPGTPLPPPLAEDIPRVATLDLERHHCRWPCVDDPLTVPAGAPLFCGAQRVPGSSYCTHHTLRSQGGAAAATETWVVPVREMEVA
jgi:GcrA cell cycle regulator